MASTEDKSDRPKGGRGLAAWFAVLLAAVISPLYAMQPDAAYALTIWPAWVWVIPALPAIVLAARRSRAHGALTLIVWIAFAGVFVEEFFTMPRGLFPSADVQPGEVQVVSLNCMGGDGAAVVEAVSHPNTLVLLQESPSPRELKLLVEAVWGTQGWDLVAGPDGSIFAPGNLEELVLPDRTSNFVAARWTRAPSATPIYVVSLRLSPPVLRFDYWNPECWTAYARDKRSRREELAGVVAFLDRLPAGAPVIVGGDFNAPPDRSIQWSLRARYLDTFEASGRGWGATGTNDNPMVRIDQIWVRRGMSARSARSTKSRRSDHRLAIAIVGLGAFQGTLR